MVITMRSFRPHSVNKIKESIKAASAKYDTT